MQPPWKNVTLIGSANLRHHSACVKISFRTDSFTIFCSLKISDFQNVGFNSVQNSHKFSEAPCPYSTVNCCALQGLYVAPWYDWCLKSPACAVVDDNYYSCYISKQDVNYQPVRLQHCAAICYQCIALSNHLTRLPPGHRPCKTCDSTLNRPTASSYWHLLSRNSIMRVKDAPQAQ